MDNQQHNILLYQTDSTIGCVRYVNEAFWLTQKAMTELFGVKVPNISKHLSNIEEGQRKKAIVSKMEIVQFYGERQVKKQEKQFFRRKQVINNTYLY